jgi:type 1 glutamine amidotransferase
MRHPRVLSLLALVLLAAPALASMPTVLVFSKTSGFRHDSIPTAVAAVQRTAMQESLDSNATEDAAVFTAENLKGYRAVIFVNTTGDVLDAAQQQALHDFIDNGGGFMGVHSAADTEYDWPWYGELVGAWFLSHPPGLQATRVQFSQDGIADTGREWKVTDEIYNYRDNPRPRVQVLATVTEADYAGGTMGADHPISWCHAQGQGRSWYTGLGHDARLYEDATFLRQLARGLRYVSRRSDEC